MKCGERVKAKRKSLKMTRESLAEKSGVSVMSIRRYENLEREPRLDAIKKIASALNCTIFDLVDNWEEFSLEDQKDAVIFGGQKAAMNAMYDLLNLEEKKKVDIYVSDMLTIHNYSTNVNVAPSEGSDTTPDSDGVQATPDAPQDALE